METTRRELPETSSVEGREPEVDRPESPAESTGGAGRLAAAARTASRLLRHEWTLASVAGLLLAVVLTWPTLKNPWTTIPGDLADPTLQTWQVAWAGHALLTDPLAIWHANALWPATYSYVYTDTLLGYAPAGLFGSGVEAAVFRYNLLFVFAYALAFVGAYALVRQLGGVRTAAAVAGIAWAFAPWRMAHSGHLNILSTGGIALCLAMLARGHGWSLREGHRPHLHRPGWIVAGWLVAAWQVSLGLAIGLPLIYILAAAGVVVAVGLGWSRWRGGRWVLGRRVVVANLVGGALFGAVCIWLGTTYLRVVELYPQARRDLSWTEMFSPPLRGYLVAPADSWLWGDYFETARSQLSWPPEMTLLPGVTLIMLGVAGLSYSAFRLRYRLMLGLGVLVSGALGLGSNLAGGGDPGYMTLSRLLPGWDALRTPGRLMVWTSLLLAVLAAGAITEFVRQLPDTGWQRVAGRIVLVVPLVLVLAEGVNRTPTRRCRPRPRRSARPPNPCWSSPARASPNSTSCSGPPRGSPGSPTGSPTSYPQPAGHPHDEHVLPRPGQHRLPPAGRHPVRGRPAGSAGRHPWDGVTFRPVEGLGITREEIDGAVLYRLD